MFVKKSWNTKEKKRYYQFHIVESYRDKNTGKNKHRYLLNISKLPMHVIEAIDLSLKQGKTVIGPKVNIKAGDCLRGAGALAIHRMWKKTNIDRALKGLSVEKKKSVQLMAIQRILKPGSKLSLKRTLKDTIFKEVWSDKRFDEDELYEVMDDLNENFYTIQEALRKTNDDQPVMLLYDITSTYFEGTKADDGEYGHSRDKRWDRYQIVIGLVCTGEGLPLAIEVWPGNTTDKTTVSERVSFLKERFGIKRAIFVGDSGMYTSANIEEIISSGFDYILKPEWHKQKQQLEKQLPFQQELFACGNVEWVEDGVRYLGYYSQARKERSARQREEGMIKAEEGLQKIGQTAARGRYYSWTRLREKINDLLDYCGVKGLYDVCIRNLDTVTDPEQKARLELEFERDQEAIEQQKAVDGMYILQTSLDASKYNSEQIEASYKKLQGVELAFRNIKSFLGIRPIYHYKRRRVRAHVLICFLAYYLLKKIELECREHNITQEIAPLLRYWDNLQLVSFSVTVGEHSSSEWQWSLGTMGEEIKGQLETIGWWRSLDKYRCSLLNS